MDSLPLTARERLVAPEPLVFHVQKPPDTLAVLTPIRREVGQVGRRLGGVLLAVGGEQLRAHRSGIGAKKARGDASEGALAASVVADDARPANGKGGARIGKRGRSTAGIGVADRGEIQLHGELLGKEAAPR